MNTDKYLTEGASFWARVEVVGRRTYYGQVTVESLGGAAFFRVDIPEKPPGVREERGQYRLAEETMAVWGRYRIHEGSVPGQTILIGTGSIYQITPMPEEAARKLHYEGVNGETLSVERIEQTALPAVDFDAQNGDPDEDANEDADDADDDPRES